MKFGKYLASRQLQLPEYSGHFIDYKALKKLIKQLAIPTCDDLTGSNMQLVIQQRLKENKASFFFRVERELEKVNSFYLEKQANLAVNLDLLIMKKNELLSYDQASQPQTGQQLPSNFRNSISYLNLYQNFKKIHQDLIRLQQFIELNETGFSKVVKKWDKRSKSHTKELFILTAVSVQPVFHKNEINEVSDTVTQNLFDLESILDGDFSSLGYVPNVPTDTIKTTTTPPPRSATDKEFELSSSARRDSMFNINNNEIDELYTSFVNIATTKDTDISLLSRWIDKVSKNASQSSPNQSKISIKFDSACIHKLSKIFLLSLSNLKISDSFLELFLKLIDNQIDFTFVNDDFHNNRNAIHECCSIPSAPSALENHVIINNGVKVINSSDSIVHSRSFLIKYIVNNLPLQAITELLISKDFNGRSGLHYASQNNRLDLLELILPLFPKSHIDDLDNESMSPLLLAIKYGNFEVIIELVKAGSDCFPESKEGKLQYLPINYACKFGDYNTVEYLLSNSKSKELTNQQDVEGLFPVHVVSRSGHYKLIKLLIQYGADINKTDGLNKWTPLFYSSLEGHVKTTQELFKHGAKVDVVDQDGYNVLYYCVLEGHIEVLNELLKYSNSLTPKKNESNGSSGNGSLASSTSNTSKVVSPLDPSFQTSFPSILDNDDDSEDSGRINKESNVDNIPDLQLPPPILPLRRYGHNFLEQKVLIELIFPNDSNFITLFDSVITDLKPGRLTLTSNISDIVPRNILLPLSNDTNSFSNCVFQTDIDSLHEFRIDFEIFPKFGTRLIAKTTALSFSHIDTSSPEINSIQIPLFDLRLRNIGELKFKYQIIFPFSGNLLETSKFDTYWKSSTSFVKNRQTLKLNAAGGLSPNNFLSPANINGSNAPANGNGSASVATTSDTTSSVVTATSLSGEYLRIKICLLNDGTPIVCPHWSISITEDIDLYLPNLSLEQLSSITNNLFDYNKVIQDLSRMTYKDIGLIKKLLRIIFLPLDILLDVLSVDINLNLELIFPSTYELENLPFVGNIQLNVNNFIDFTLNDVFNHVRSSKSSSVSPQNSGSSVGSHGRSIIFLSSNSLICKILNWKQPNFPVFLIMNGVTYNNLKKKFESRTTNGLLLDEISKKSVKPNDGNHQETTIRSIKEAVDFTISNNLIGLITSIHLLNLVPKLVPLIRSRGLVLVASSDIFDNDNEEAIGKDLDSYTRTEISGLRFDDVLSFKEDISM